MSNPPKVLLIGAGQFGQHYVRLLTSLANEGAVVFAGVVVRSAQRAAELAARHHVVVYTELTDKLVASVDAVIIATPPETHAALVAQCISYTHVFVEKPVAMSAEEVEPLAALAATSGNVLMVGHILRFHPVTHELQSLMRDLPPPPQIMGEFINPVSTDQDRDPSLELLHLYDVLESIWPVIELREAVRRDAGRLAKMSMRFEGGTVAQLELGWFAEQKTRRLVFVYPERRIEADFANHTVTVTDQQGSVTSHHEPAVELLRAELEAFLGACTGGENPIPLAIGRKIVSWAERLQAATARMFLPDRRPKVAVIGGGMFGCNAAAVLAEESEVVLYERNQELLREGAWANCFRHHAGYHYPRSDETVRDVRVAASPFEAWYKEALVPDVPTYYGLARDASYVNSEVFKDFCERLNLPLELSDEAIFPESEVVTTVKVSEPCYHYDTLTKLVTERLQKTSTQICTGATVTSATVLPSGAKQLTITRADGSVQVEEFDMVINATYAAINWFTHSLGVPPVPIRVDWAEVVIVELPYPPISLTVIDGPFACLLPTGNPNEFTLYHVIESVLERYTPADGRVRPLTEHKTNALAIFERSLPYFPFLREGKITGSRQVFRGVQAYREHDDGRVAEIYDHGFDCYSILSGKIISSVALAQRLAEVMRHHRVGASGS
jgi:predicted dehydrogenase